MCVPLPLPPQLRDPSVGKKPRTFTGNSSSWRCLTEESLNLDSATENNRLRSVGPTTLHCDDCNKNVSMETAKVHCAGKKHRMRKCARQGREQTKREGKQSSIRKTLKTDGKSEFEVAQDGYRFAIVASCLKAGVPVSAIDIVRPAIEKGSRFTLTSSPNLRREFVPAIHKWEMGNVADVVGGRPFAWFHDAATRMKECLAIVVRVLERSEVTGKLAYKQVLVRLKMLPKSSTADTLAGDQAAGLAAVGLRMEDAVYANGCSTNVAAIEVMEHMFTDTFFALCMAHLGANTGSKLAGTEIDKFFKDFVGIMNHSTAMKADWKRITGQPWVGYGGVRWFNRHDVLVNVLCTFGREGTMQIMLTVLGAAGTASAPGRNLRTQGDYSTATRTEQLHVELVTSIAMGEILKEITYFAEADQLNTSFGMHTKVLKVDRAFSAVRDATIATDLITTKITALHAAGHLQTHDLQHWIDHAMLTAEPAMAHWTTKSNTARHGQQRKSYKVANCFRPDVCGTRTVQDLKAHYKELRGLKFPDALVDGLVGEAEAAIEECNGVGEIIDVVNFWDARRESFPHHAAATQRLALMQPSEASVERVFSRLKSHFSTDQMVTILNDYVEAAIMLDHNCRDVVAAWC